MAKSKFADRRALIQAVLGAGVAATLGSSGCRRAHTLTGELRQPNFELGHRLRDGYQIDVPADAWQEVGTVIVGGGIAGLSAAWRLMRSGYEDFVVLELEDAAGGTARYGDSGVAPHPWGAHYVPVPMAENRALIALLSEMGTIEGLDAQGQPQVREVELCRDPHERLFMEGTWVEGLYPSLGASEEDQAQLTAFRRKMEWFAAQQDEAGRRWFQLPMAAGSSAAEVRRLDHMSMAQWLDREGFTSPRLRWLVDYACRDDYGAPAQATSAWAGLFYFAARLQAGATDSQPVITWPEGNGRIVRHLAGATGSYLHTGHAVCRVRPTSSGRVDVAALDTTREQSLGFATRRVIFAAGQFLAPYLIEGLPTERAKAARAFQYGSWVVANLHLQARPAERSFPLCWDNVLYQSKSLGYVVATHQQGVDHGPTVLTWYYPLPEDEPRGARQQLLELAWEDWVEVALTDLEQAHPEIRALVTRIDVMRWGHAMVQPRPGFIWSRARQDAAQPWGAIHFAGTDLSGVALLEEAFYHGVRAAEEVLASEGRSTESIL